MHEFDLKLRATLEIQDCISGIDALHLDKIQESLVEELPKNWHV